MFENREHRADSIGTFKLSVWVIPLSLIQLENNQSYDCHLHSHCKVFFLRDENSRVVIGSCRSKMVMASYHINYNRLENARAEPRQISWDPHDANLIDTPIIGTGA